MKNLWDRKYFGLTLNFFGPKNLFWQHFFYPKFFLTKICLPQFFYQNFYKIYFDPKILLHQIFLPQKILYPQLFFTRIFFYPFLPQKCFGNNIFFGTEKVYFPYNLFNHLKRIDPENFLDQKTILTQELFLTQNFFGPEIFLNSFFSSSTNEIFQNLYGVWHWTPKSCFFLVIHV